MKKSKFISLSTFFAWCIFFGSCSEKENSTTNTTAENTLSTKIAAKWNVDDASTGFKSFEFNKSSQAIVTKLSGKSTSHSYKVKDAKTVEIKDLGTLNVDEISGSDLKMKITLNGKSAPIQIVSKKSTKEVSGSEKTGTVCRTWKLTKLTKNGANQDLPSSDPILVTFTNAGTYFVSFVSDEVDSVGSFTSYWKWSNSSENEFCYDKNETPSCTKKVLVPTLTATSFVADENGSVSYWVPFTFPARIATTNTTRPANVNFYRGLFKNSFLF